MGSRSRCQIVAILAAALLCVWGAGPVAAEDGADEVDERDDHAEESDELAEPRRRETTAGGGPEVTTRILQQMHILNRFAIEAGEIAEERASDGLVRRLADRLLRDHRMASDRVQHLSTRVNISLPVVDFESLAERPSERLSERQRTMSEAIGQLKELEGEAFDRAYLAATRDNHRRLLDTLDESAAEIEEDDVEEFVDAYLPILEQHVDLERSVRRRFGADSAD